jgi:ADP-ribose pyrophosphatase YjhB (NUDIX family)
MSEALAAQLAAYAQYEPDQADEAAGFLRFLHSHADVFHRHHPPGHFTGSAWLVDATGRLALLTHHRKLQRWLQPGGHADGEMDVAAVASREAEEESGIVGLVLLPQLFDIDRHRIPARGTEPEHWHYDLRFVLCAPPGASFEVGPESIDLAWVAIERIASEPEFDPSLARMARRWLLRAQVVETKGRGTL